MGRREARPADRRITRGATKQEAGIFPASSFCDLEGNMKAIKINLAGRERYLAFNGEAMFKLREEFGGVTETLEALKGDTRDSLDATCRAAAILAEQGELIRRYMGYDPEPITDAETVAATIAPVEIMALKLAIPAAISLGFGREVEKENDVVDLGLAELNAQKKTN